MFAALIRLAVGVFLSGQKTVFVEYFRSASDESPTSNSDLLCRACCCRSVLWPTPMDDTCCAYLVWLVSGAAVAAKPGLGLRGEVADDGWGLDDLRGTWRGGGGD